MRPERLHAAGALLRQPRAFFNCFAQRYCVQGGKFVLTVKGEDLPQLDQWWLHAVLAAIGEVLEVTRQYTEDAQTGIRPTATCQRGEQLFPRSVGQMPRKGEVGGEKAGDPP